MKIRNVLFALLLSTSTAFAALPGEVLDKCKPGIPLEKSGTIAKSVDGDTVHVTTRSGTYSVRMLGIDTPETHFMGKSQGEWGEKAAARNQELIPVGTKVSLDFGGEPCDSHGRVLAFIFKGKTNINAQLAGEGLAVNYCVAPTFEYCDIIGREVGQAIEQREGMFSDPNAELPYDFRRRLQGHEQRSYVGNFTTKEVLPPGNQNSVPVAERVFFYTADEIRAPFHLVK